LKIRLLFYQRRMPINMKGWLSIVFQSGNLYLS
jgi:hypothetical protein